MLSFAQRELGLRNPDLDDETGKAWDDTWKCTTWRSGMIASPLSGAAYIYSKGSQDCVSAEIFDIGLQQLHR